MKIDTPIKLSRLYIKIKAIEIKDTMTEEVKQAGRGRRPAKKPETATKDGAAAGKEETKAAQRPKTAGRGGKRGGAQGAAAGEEKKDGATRGGRRPQTARQAADAAEGKEETKGQDKKGGNGKGPRPTDKQQDKNSWIYKYHNMERIQYEKIEFTADTVVKEIPTGKDRLKEPAKAEFDRSMQD